MNQMNEGEVRAREAGTGHRRKLRDSGKLYNKFFFMNNNNIYNLFYRKKKSYVVYNIII